MAVQVTAWEINRAVWERFEGVPPMRDGEIDLSAIIVAVLDELQRWEIIDVEQQ